MNSPAVKQHKRLAHPDLAKMRLCDEKIAMLTCYDASFAALCDQAGVDSLLIGDSLGMVLQGHDSPLPVTLDDIAYHTSAVARGARRALIIADLPFGCSQESPALTFRHAAVLMRAGAQMVKLEGGVEMAETTAFLTQRGIPVCAHIGLTPQSVHQLGGFRVQGKEELAAKRIIDDALSQQAAGAAMIVLEAMPASLGAEITDALVIPTIGIGAGKDCSGQVLVLHDMLDIPPGKKARFVKNFMVGQSSILGGVSAYVEAVKRGDFPTAEQCY